MSSTEVKIPMMHLHHFVISEIWKQRMKQVELVPLLCRAFMRINASCKEYEKEGLVMLNLLFRKITLVYKAELIKVLINHPSAQEKAVEYNVVDTVLRSGLLSASRAIARQHRKIITPAFHLKILEDYIEVFNEKSIKMVRKIEDRVNEPWISIDEYIKECTLDIICQTAMGVQIDTDKEAAVFMKCVEENLNIIVDRMYRPWTRNDFLFGFTSAGRKLRKYYDRGMQFVDRVIKESREALVLEMKNGSKNRENGLNQNKENVSSKRKSFMRVLLEAHLADPSFTLNDLRDEVATFVVGGAETASMAVGMTLVMLGLYRDVQETAIQEIDSIFANEPNRFASFDDIKAMEYLECVVKESLRLYPSAPIVAKELKEDIYLGKYRLPAGTGVAFNLFMLHRDKEYFPDPEKFDPRRFSPENIQKRHPYAYLPFSAGARNCIGQKFGVIEMKCIISTILRNFRIEAIDHRDKINFSFRVMMRNVNPLRLKFIPRYACSK